MAAPLAGANVGVGLWNFPCDREQKAQSEICSGIDECVRHIGRVDSAPLHKRQIQVVHANRHIGDHTQPGCTIQEFGIHPQLGLIHDAGQFGG